jgi:DNA-directed RNA polymerase subunit RPC12/RpoP
MIGKIIDVTDKVEKGYTDDGITAILKCVCGYDKLFLITEEGSEEYDPHNSMLDKSSKCPSCGRRFIFKVQVYELVEGDE